MIAPELVLEHAVCPGCACLCDDLTLTVAGGRVTQAVRACALGQAWYAAQPSEPPVPALVRGQPARFEAALAAAAQILRAARAPLVAGLEAATSEAQQAAVALADRLGALVDGPPGAAEHAGNVFRGAGQSTATLGDVRNRADLVLVWGGDPAMTHPRLFERYAVAPVGQFVPTGRAGRTVVVVNAARTADRTPRFDAVARLDRRTAATAPVGSVGRTRIDCALHELHLAVPPEPSRPVSRSGRDGPRQQRRLPRVARTGVGSSRVDLQACKLEYSIVSPK